MRVTRAIGHEVIERIVDPTPDPQTSSRRSKAATHLAGTDGGRVLSMALGQNEFGPSWCGRDGRLA
jgi:hypothetical protein